MELSAKKKKKKKQKTLLLWQKQHLLRNDESGLYTIKWFDPVSARSPAAAVCRTLFTLFTYCDLWLTRCQTQWGIEPESGPRYSVKSDCCMKHKRIITIIPNHSYSIFSKCNFFSYTIGFCLEVLGYMPFGYTQYFWYVQQHAHGHRVFFLLLGLYIGGTLCTICCGCVTFY